ncbi:DUF1336 domain containing protein [Nitzschia inconspicua]|uniref:DUF1336 domain containing protein n=1 Tax=Nitzschia inconspicua TaxID=303405 RepID=A0A9K3KYN3_9STRA|nr:DUF1336 domain containing protein [Nitzschia inconspicua]
MSTFDDQNAIVTHDTSTKEDSPSRSTTTEDISQESRKDSSETEAHQDDGSQKSIPGKVVTNATKMIKPRSKMTPPKNTESFEKSEVRESSHHMKQAFKAIGTLSSKANKALQRPVDSLHSIGEAVKKSKASSASSKRKKGYASLSSHQPFLRNQSIEDEATLESAPSEGYLQEENFRDKQRSNSTIHNSSESSLPSVIKRGPKLGNDTSFLTDTYIFWTVVLSILSLQLCENWKKILNNQFTVGTVIGLMLLAFAVGLEIDQEAFLQQVKHRILSIDTAEHEQATWETSNSLCMVQGHSVEKQQQLSGGTKTKMDFFRRIFRKRSTPNLPKSKRESFTSLNKRFGTTAQRKEEHATKNKDLMRRVSLLCSRKTQNKTDSSKLDSRLEDSHFTQASYMPSITMGEATLDDARAVDRLEEVSTPLCSIRGLDFFRTDAADPDMITHPYLIQNGLRSFPTFFINFLTMYGNILVYFKLPDWVTDWGQSLVEREGDPADVIALKRFLKGDDKYKIKCFKVMPELVNGPLAVKLLAPHNRAFPLNFQGFTSTTYAQEAPTKDQCPAMSLTVDLISNSTIRSMVGIFKRNMHRMTVDFACIIDPGEEDGPTCVLGLWRMDHLVDGDFPDLPDRYDEGGGNPEKTDSIRGNLIIKRLSEACSTQESLLQTVVESSESF